MPDKRVSEMTDDEIRALAGASDPVASELAAIKERSAKSSPSSERHVIAHRESARDVPALLGALEAALAELAKHQLPIIDQHGTVCAGCLYDLPCPSSARITAALLGKEAADHA